MELRTSLGRRRAFRPPAYLHLPAFPPPPALLRLPEAWLSDHTWLWRAQDADSGRGAARNIPDLARNRRRLGLRLRAVGSANSERAGSFICANRCYPPLTPVADKEQIFCSPRYHGVANRAVSDPSSDGSPWFASANHDPGVQFGGAQGRNRTVEESLVWQSRRCTGR